jgi:hypothetical protein
MAVFVMWPPGPVFAIAAREKWWLVRTTAARGKLVSRPWVWTCVSVSLARLRAGRLEELDGENEDNEAEELDRRTPPASTMACLVARVIFAKDCRSAARREHATGRRTEDAMT